MDQRTRKTPARFLGPLALIVVVIAFLAIVSGSGGSGSNDNGDSSSSTPASKTSTTKTSTGSTGSTSAKKKANNGKKTYTIQVGDTLGGIADKTGVPLDRIETLNPSVDPHNLILGQKIKLE